MRQKLRAFLVAAGTILRLAVPSQLAGFDMHTVGSIPLIVGLLLFAF
jgi:hypothetical protein